MVPEFRGFQRGRYLAGVWHFSLALGGILSRIFYPAWSLRTCFAVKIPPPTTKAITVQLPNLPPPGINIRHPVVAVTVSGLCLYMHQTREGPECCGTTPCDDVTYIKVVTDPQVTKSLLWLLQVARGRLAVTFINSSTGSGRSPPRLHLFYPSGALQPAYVEVTLCIEHKDFMYAKDPSWCRRLNPGCIYSARYNYCT